MVAKTVKINNKINKMACTCFTHISFAPPAGTLMDCDLPIPVIVDNGTDKFNASLIALAVVKLKEISSVDCYMAEGIDRTDFIKKFCLSNPQADADTRLGIYIYRKLNDDEV